MPENWEPACSAGDKKEPACPGKKTNKSVIPPVMPNAILIPFSMFFLSAVPLKISRRARIPRRGIQNSATTSVMVTALNLLYPGKIVKKYIGKRHEILPPCKHNGQYCGRKKPPFFRTFNYYQSENKQEKYYSSHINRTVNPWLCTPVLLKLP